MFTSSLINLIFASSSGWTWGGEYLYLYTNDKLLFWQIILLLLQVGHSLANSIVAHSACPSCPMPLWTIGCPTLCQPLARYEWRSTSFLLLLIVGVSWRIKRPTCSSLTTNHHDQGSRYKATTTASCSFNIPSNTIFGLAVEEGFGLWWFSQGLCWAWYDHSFLNYSK